MKIHKHQLEQMHEQMLNDIFETVTICGYEWNAGTALRRLDSIAFSIGCDAWVDDMISDGEYYQHSDGSIHDEPET